MFSQRKHLMLCACFVTALVLFIAVCFAVASAEGIMSFDAWAADFAAMLRTPAGVMAFAWLTMLGKWKLVLVLALIVCAALWTWEKRVFLLPFLATLAATELSLALVKPLMSRERPLDALFVESSMSFPSGHAAVAAAFYGFVCYLIIQNIQERKHKITALAGALLLIILIGFSRLYLGVHFASDVLAGWLLGFAWLCLGIMLSELPLARQK